MLTCTDEEDIWFRKYLKALLQFQVAGKDAKKRWACLPSIMKVYVKRPKRAEPLFDLVRWLDGEGESHRPLVIMLLRQMSTLTFPYGDTLGVQYQLYEWWSLDQLGIHLYYAGDIKGSLEAYATALAKIPAGTFLLFSLNHGDPFVSDHSMRAHILKNQSFSKSRMPSS